MKAIYPGSFDPITSGHMDIIERASSVFDELVVAVAINLGKAPLFSVSERVHLLKEACRHLQNVTIDHFHGLLVDYVESQDAKVVVRGLRAVSDFEFEFQMALMNKRLNGNVETLFMMTSAQNLFLSSSLVKELAVLGAPVSGLVPAVVEEHLKVKLQQKMGGRER